MKIRFIRVFFYFWCFIGFTSCHLQPHKQDELKKLSYTFESSSFDNKSTILVTLEIEGDKTGKTEIRIPHFWAGTSFKNDIVGFKVENSNTVLVNGKDEFLKIINHQPNEILKVKYHIIQSVPFLGKSYNSLVTNHFFHFIGYGGLIIPSWDEKKNYKFLLKWNYTKDSYKIANSFGSFSKTQSFISNLQDFQSAIYVGGDYRIKKFNLMNKSFFVAIRGQWQFSDDEFFNMSESIVKYQRNFFNDHSFDYFLITATPNQEKCCSTGGTGLHNSFATFLADDQKANEQLKFLLSHELFHTWNGRKIERLEPEQLVYWFSEGFTDYYSRLLLLRSKQISLKEFVTDFNETLYNYYTSDVINEPNSRILKDFSNKYSVEKLPYQRGYLLARKWNTIIKKNSNNKHSLDDIFFDLYQESQNSGTLVSAENFNRIAKKYYSKGFLKDIKKYIDRGDTIIPHEYDLGPCVIKKTAKLSLFKHGYDSKETYKTNIMTGVDKKSNAYKAGLRNGQKLIDRKIIFPPFEKSKIYVEDDKGNKKWISFLPISGKLKKASYFKLDEEALKNDPEKCLVWFN